MSNLFWCLFALAMTGFIGVVILWYFSMPFQALIDPSEPLMIRGIAALIGFVILMGIAMWGIVVWSAFNED